MNTTTLVRGVSAAGTAAAVLAAGLLWAADPVPQATGTVLLLDEERLFEGDIALINGQYRVRRQVGELWLPAKPEMRLCADLEAAYALLRNRANLRDPDERMRLARWCYLRGLRRSALEEAQAAVALSPKHRDAAALAASLERSLAEYPGEIRTVSAEMPAATPEVNPPTPPADFNPDAYPLFVTKVQPVLMNACAGCHATGRGGAFRLTRAYPDAVSNARPTQFNLSAALQFIDRENPGRSPLLVKAVAPHGDASKPPLSGPQAAAYRPLEAWVMQALTQNAATVRAGFTPTPTPAPAPVLTPAPPAPAPAAVPAASRPEPALTVVPPAEPARLPSGFASDAAPARPAVAPLPPARTPPAGGEDPFDPDEFNRQTAPPG